MKRPVFVSVTTKRHLSERQRRMREAIIRRIEEEDLAPQFFDEGGIPNLSWSPENCVAVMRRCQGVVLIGFPRWLSSNRGKPIKLTTEFTHYEGVLARAMQLPILTIVEEGVAERGVIERPFRIPESEDENWIRTYDFDTRLQEWLGKVKSRHDVFLGYCSKGSPIAGMVAEYLVRKGLRVRDWQRDFRHGYLIIDEIEKAARECSHAIFLFSEDDKLLGTDEITVPRDNVVFEAGYFMNARGRGDVLIIREGKAKIPADLGGAIYAGVPSRDTTPIGEIRAAIEEKVATFLQGTLPASAIPE